MSQGKMSQGKMSPAEMSQPKKPKKRNRFGATRKLPSGRLQASYLGPDGRRRTADHTFANMTDASVWLSSVETDMCRGTWLDPRAGATSLAAYAATWIEQRQVKGRPIAPRTADTYRHSLDAWIAPTLGTMPLGKLTPEQVRTWHADVSRRTGPTATRQAYALLRAVLTTAVEDGALTRNPCMIRGAGQACSPERPLLDIAQATALADAMPEGLRAAVVLAMWAHLRLGELLGLQRGDFDASAGTLAIRRQLVETSGGVLVAEPKRGSIRTVHLPQPARDALTEHLAARPGLPAARIFTRPDGSQLRAHHVGTAWRHARAAVGLPGAHLHDLRHAGLTLTAQSGATLAEVMRRAGHVSSRAALIYQHAAEHRDAAVADRLSALAEAHSLAR